MIDTAGNAAPRSIGLALALALHAAVGFMLLDRRPSSPPSIASAPIFVHFIAPAAAAAPPKAPPPAVQTPVPEPAKAEPVPEPIVQPEPKPRPTPTPVAKPKPVPKPKPKTVSKPPTKPETALKPAPSPTPKSPTAPSEQIAETPAPPAPTPARPATAARTSALASAPATAPSEPVTQPRFDADYLRNPPPDYPRLARRLGEQGVVVLRVLVGTDGRAQRVELRSSSGSERLDRAALETVRSWTFVPARRGDAPVAAWVLVPMRFTLEG